MTKQEPSDYDIWQYHADKVNCYTITRPDGSTVHFDPDPTTIDSAQEIGELLGSLVTAANQQPPAPTSEPLRPEAIMRAYLDATGRDGEALDPDVIARVVSRSPTTERAGALVAHAHAHSSGCVHDPNHHTLSEVERATGLRSLLPIKWRRMRLVSLRLCRCMH